MASGADIVDPRLERARAGDSAALTALLAAGAAALRGALARRVPPDLRSRIDADDLVQETHITVFQNLAGFTPEGPGSFERWVRAIGIYKLRRVLRDLRAAKRGGGWRRADPAETPLLDWLASEGRTASRSVARSEMIAALRVAIGELPEDYRAALSLIYLDGCSVAEAAGKMGRSDRAIHNLCFKGKQRLRDILPAGMGSLSTWR